MPKLALGNAEGPQFDIPGKGDDLKMGDVAFQVQGDTVFRTEVAVNYLGLDAVEIARRIAQFESKRDYIEGEIAKLEEMAAELEAAQPEPAPPPK